MKRLSIKRQLLTLFVPYLFGLWIASAVLSFWLVSRIAGDSFDKELINSADSVVGRLRTKEGKIVVDLPPAAIAVLKHDDSDKFYYRVMDSNGIRISGDTDLPPPSPGLQIDIPRIVKKKISQTDVYIAEIKVAPDEAGDKTVVVQVAQTANVRNRLQDSMLASIAIPQLLVIMVGLLAVWYGIAKILTPLKSLQQQVMNRAQFDLSPLSDIETPEEVYPLVKALNSLLHRLKEDIKAQQRFIANAAHQLRTPLAGLKTYSSIGSEMCNSEDLKHIVHELDQGIDRASRMVSQLLALARTDGGDPEITNTTKHVDLNFLASDIVADLVGQSIQKNLELVYEPSELPAVVLGEQTGLKHLITNLVENAILYTPPGGRIAVRVRHNGKVVFSVSDTGVGIPIEEREKVFERFYRMVGTYGNGSGLGLSIVKEVANAHNARVTIDSAPGSTGTLVQVEFPAGQVRLSSRH